MKARENLEEARYIGKLIIAWGCLFVYLLWKAWDRAL